MPFFYQNTAQNERANFPLPPCQYLITYARPHSHGLLHLRDSRCRTLLCSSKLLSMRASKVLYGFQRTGIYLPSGKPLLYLLVNVSEIWHLSLKSSIDSVEIPPISFGRPDALFQYSLRAWLLLSRENS
jgi:hypothetical protein